MNTDLPYVIATVLLTAAVIGISIATLRTHCRHANGDELLDAPLYDTLFIIVLYPVVRIAIALIYAAVSLPLSGISSGSIDTICTIGEHLACVTVDTLVLHVFFNLLTHYFYSRARVVYSDRFRVLREHKCSINHRFIAARATAIFHHHIDYVAVDIDDDDDDGDDGITNIGERRHHHQCWSLRWWCHLIPDATNYSIMMTLVLRIIVSVHMLFDMLATSLPLGNNVMKLRIIDIIIVAITSLLFLSYVVSTRDISGVFLPTKKLLTLSGTLVSLLVVPLIPLTHGVAVRSLFTALMLLVYVLVSHSLYQPNEFNERGLHNLHAIPRIEHDFEWLTDVHEASEKK